MSSSPPIVRDFEVSQKSVSEKGIETAQSIVLVDEDELESQRELFTRLYSIHIYSLSSTKLDDLTAISATVEPVLRKYAYATNEEATKWGVIRNENAVQTKQVKKAAINELIEIKPAKDVKDVKDVKPSVPDSVDHKIKDKSEKPLKQSGKLDFSKAKKTGAVSSVKQMQPDSGIEGSKGQVKSTKGNSRDITKPASVTKTKSDSNVKMEIEMEMEMETVEQAVKREEELDALEKMMESDGERKFPKLKKYVFIEFGIFELTLFGGKS